ncbi:biotin-dependent carboxyltransferase family protein [Salicibibacter halophilus]|uniref:Biotin-dependent carboxyltransferase family protein n=1 Tax=Salicibibacter halophilus TaxID=2502791 RepID=A0A514LGY5_9BACI|nr:biotin-dependent carboxyltransferase family protein [Salicibibacter halophilus]QDI91117.1 biotin-dependent carboxyltransferase family protein [Salicibibacter halophilus]
MSLQVVKPGLFTTVQDLGRNGFLHQGVLESGAMDRISLRTANMIVGNDENDAVLELTLNGPEIKMEADCLITVTGGGIVPVINGTPFSLGVPIFIPAKSNLNFQPANHGSRAYLAVAGGIDVPVVMDSKSTYVRAGIGGLEGRSLDKGDRLHVGKKKEKAKKRLQSISEKASGKPLAEQWGANGPLLERSRKTIRVFPGTHFDQFTSTSQKQFFQQSYTVSSRSDRMGYRLQSNEPLKRRESTSLLSEPVAFGTVQVPSDGQPIVLMADRQTTGGYPRFAQVAAVDIGKIAQSRPNEPVSFEKITLEEAESLLIRQEKAMREREIGIHLKWGDTDVFS